MHILHVEVPATCKRQHRRIGLSRVDIRPSGSRTRRPGQITDPQWQRDVTGQTAPRRGKTCLCPMVVSQWGLNSKNYRGKTGPGHSMVVSQWSSPERKVLRSPWLAAAPTWCPRASKVSTDSQRGGHTRKPESSPSLGDCNGPSRAQANKVRRQGDVRAHSVMSKVRLPSLPLLRPSLTG